ncbi:MAG: endopeptidase La [Firmicutes bacterium]|nr:endopeptidase La [Bacillota bacterium]
MIEEINITPEQISEQPHKKGVVMIALRGIVPFPGQAVSFDISREKSILALNKILEGTEDIFLVAQKNVATIRPAPEDIYTVGVLANIKQVLRVPGDIVRVIATCKERMEIGSYVALSPYFVVELKELPPVYSYDPTAMEALKRIAAEQFEIFKQDCKIPKEALLQITPNNPERFIATLAPYLFATDADRQRIMEEPSLYNQLEAVTTKLMGEADLIRTSRDIDRKVRANIDKNQREYMLREKVKVIQEELGDNEDEYRDYMAKAEKADLPDNVMAKVKKELDRLKKMPPTSPESAVIRTYVETVTDMPWNKATLDSRDIKKAEKILDEDHYGLEKVKKRILEFIAVLQLTNAIKGSILCFVGPPGVGKTSIVSSIARAIDRKFVSMSLGGVRDEAEIRGHRRTYIGSLPGRIISGIKQSEVNNPVFLLDEIDKMSSDFRGDPASAMLEVLDPNQNFKFIDHYLEVPFDLSKTLFVATANTVDTIPAPLLDRMEIIELSGYTYEEKLEIAKRYLIPKQLEANGLTTKSMTIEDKAVENIIEGYTRESGVRNLEREIAQVARRVAVDIVSDDYDKNKTRKVTVKDLSEYLGTVKFDEAVLGQNDEVGLATGLAWTQSGGKTLNIEVDVIAGGKGELTLTGNLGDVMKESCQAALTLVKSRADKYGIDRELFKSNDFHIHVPEGATPKDGPSAGITMATVLLSVLSGIPVDRRVAMTGEVTLRGKVLAIGGLKEKLLAGMRHGAKKVIIPEANKKDVADLPKIITKTLEIVYADNIDTVFENALIKNKGVQKQNEKRTRGRKIP